MLDSVSTHCGQLFSEALLYIKKPTSNFLYHLLESVTVKAFVKVPSGTHWLILCCGKQKQQCEPPTVFTSSAFSVPHSRHRARLSVPSLHESSYSLGQVGQDCPCWADLMLPGLTMVELCCYINIYFSLVSLPFCLLLQPRPSGQPATRRARLCIIIFCWFCAADQSVP